MFLILSKKGVKLSLVIISTLKKQVNCLSKPQENVAGKLVILPDYVIKDRPLKIRLCIRDTFEPPTAPVQKALARLNETVGYQFELVIAWVDIHRDLGPSFLDETVLVPSVTGALISYLDRIVALLDEENFQDKFLEKVESIRRITVAIGDQTDKDETVFDKTGKWIVYLPKTGPEWYRRMSSRMGHDLEDVFLNEKKAQKPRVAAATSAPTHAHVSDWVDVNPSAVQNKVTSLPSLDFLSKPESLFPSLLPYYVIVTNGGARIHVEASHQPTLELLHGYFKAHTRKNMNLTTQVNSLVRFADVQAPFLDVELKQSNWGSQMYEVDIHLNDQRSASWAPTGGVTLVLSFLVSVCGYDLEKSEPGWYFLKREQAYE